MPGALPTLNGQAVVGAVKAALALSCQIQKYSVWARKNYFYPDLPKGYQISQYDKPYALGGHVDLLDKEGQTKRIGLTRIHIEEDAGKNIHVGSSDCSLIDFNRASVPLIEIVSNPEITSAEEAALYLKHLHQILVAIEVCDGNMEEGSFRCDANVSIRPKGEQRFGTRTELKNINSFKFVTQAIQYEIERQKELLESGGVIIQETRLWDSVAKVTKSMRRKEAADDYRYFPDPDLPPLLLSEEEIKAIKQTMPELPQHQAARFSRDYGLSSYDAQVLCSDSNVARYFEDTLAIYSDKPKAVANWLMTELLRETSAKNIGIRDLKITPAHLAELVRLVEDSVISGKIGKDLVVQMLNTGDMPALLVDKQGLRQVTDTAAIEACVEKVLQRSESQIAQYRAGKTNLLGYFVGQVIKEMQGKANPERVNELLKKHLG